MLCESVRIDPSLLVEQTRGNASLFPLSAEKSPGGSILGFNFGRNHEGSFERTLALKGLASRILSLDS